MNLHERIEWGKDMIAIARDLDGELYQYDCLPGWSSKEWSANLGNLVNASRLSCPEIKPGQGITRDGEWFYAPGFEPGAAANAGETTMNKTITTEYAINVDWGWLATVETKVRVIDGHRGDTDIELRGRFSVSGDDVDYFVEEFEALILKYKI